MAACHPVGFQWVMAAKERGGKIIHVDPRFTRTSAVADLHVPLRAGTDIVFLGAIVNYIIEHERYFKEYVLHYTNATAIVTASFRDTEDLDGLFSGWDAEKGEYDPKSWQYQDVAPPPAMTNRAVFSGESFSERGTQPSAVHHDPTLQDPNCVFQIVKRHFARYTPAMVEEICGVTPERFLKVAETLCNNSGRERTSAFCYAVGWTQHSVGAQYIRTAAIVQLLLGNIGRPGGGIMALRGHASIQGSTDIPTLYDMLPGSFLFSLCGPYREGWQPSSRRVIAAVICTFSITWGGCSKRVTRDRLIPRIAISVDGVKCKGTARRAAFWLGGAQRRIVGSVLAGTGGEQGRTGWQAIA